MFDSDYRLHGKHATYAKFLKDDAKIFNYIIDVYMNGAIYGLLYNKKVERDRDSKDNVNILASQFIERQSACEFIYRLVMLLDDSTSLTTDERIDRAFRDDSVENNDEKMKANMELFNSYVRGGIEQLYEDFITGCTTEDDYLSRINEIVSDLKDSFETEDVSLEIEKLLNF